MLLKNKGEKTKDAINNYKKRLKKEVKLKKQY
jgi:hypothetical protein